MINTYAANETMKGYVLPLVTVDQASHQVLREISKPVTLFKPRTKISSKAFSFPVKQA